MGYTIRMSARYYTLTEAAQALGISRQRLYTLIDDGRIKTVDTAGGTSRLVPAREIEKGYDIKPGGRPLGSTKKS